MGVFNIFKELISSNYNKSISYRWDPPFFFLKKSESGTTIPNFNLDVVVRYQDQALALSCIN